MAISADLPDCPVRMDGADFSTRGTIRSSAIEEYMDERPGEAVGNAKRVHVKHAREEAFPTASPGRGVVLDATWPFFRGGLVEASLSTP